MVGNDFVEPRPRLQLATLVASADPTNIASITPVVISRQQSIQLAVKPAGRPLLGRLLDSAHRHSLIAFALLFLLVATSGIEVGGSYYAARFAPFRPTTAPAKHDIAGLNLNVPASQLTQKIAAISGQAASLTVGSQAVPISPDVIKSWLRVTASADKSQDFIYLKTDAMTKSLSDMANKFVKTPVDQVSVTHDGTTQVIVAGRDGARLSDPAGLASQSGQLAKTVMDNKGLQFNAPLATLPFQAVTPAVFSKLIEVDVVTKQMYLYDNGTLTRSYPISAGAPATPTPIGQFHIYSKLSVEDMKGFNANGTPYFQPHVHWISYFLPGGYAIHGNYWRPLSWFGAINSSHGCVSLPDSQAEWVYNWTPVGTTVITHY